MRSYQHGAIYIIGADMKSTRWVYGDISKRYEELGGPASPLGFPLTAEMAFAEGGRVQGFQKGDIYWWPDTGAIDVTNVTVQYTGLVCYGESDKDQFFTAADEPYVVLGVTTPDGPGMVERGRIHEDVDAIEGRRELIEVYCGKPLGIVISVLLMEHDEEDPDKYKDAMRAAVSASAGALAGAIALIPAVGAPLALIAAPLLQAVAPTVADAMHEALDLGDDDLGLHNLTLSAKQLVVHAGRTKPSDA